MRVLLLCVLLVLCFFVTACQESELQDGAAITVVDGAKMSVVLDPDFSWASFMRFWHRGADKDVSLEQAKREDGGYRHDYGHGVSVFIPMRGNYVLGAVVQFASIAGHDKGGRQFILLMEHVMRLGGFQWGAEQRELLHAYYEVMAPQTKEFYYKNAYFIRTYDAPSKLWTFRFYFVQSSNTLRAIPQL